MGEPSAAAEASADKWFEIVGVVRDVGLDPDDGGDEQPYVFHAASAGTVSPFVENTQERERTTTTTLEGVVSSIARERNQITGFNLTGYSGTPTPTSETEGPRVDSCPSGPWTLTTPAGDPEMVSQTVGLQVSINGTDWFDLQ